MPIPPRSGNTTRAAPPDACCTPMYRPALATGNDAREKQRRDTRKCERSPKRQQAQLPALAAGMGRSATAEHGRTRPSLAANAAGSCIQCMNGIAPARCRQQRLAEPRQPAPRRNRSTAHPRITRPRQHRDRCRCMCRNIRSSLRRDAEARREKERERSRSRPGTAPMPIA